MQCLSFKNRCSVLLLPLLKKFKIFLLSGIGASICCSQTEILLAQYFRLKLSVVNDLIEAIIAIGFIATPILLGDNIIKHGILRVLLTYQTVILQGVIVSAVFKKPNYLKSRRRTYDYISVRKQCLLLLQCKLTLLHLGHCR